MTRFNRLRTNWESHTFLIKHCLIPGIFNGLLNGILAIYTYPKATNILMWGQDAYGIDLIFTAFLIPAISWLFVFSMISDREVGAVPMRNFIVSVMSLMIRLSSSRGIGLFSWGAVGILIFSVPILICLQALGSPNMNGINYAIFKGVFAATISSILQPIMVGVRIQYFRAISGKCP
jgi:hypothetical protein